MDREKENYVDNQSYVHRQNPSLERSRGVRYAWICLGAINFALGTIGIVLPLLPTVPFYLLTLFCLSRGSERFHDKFVQSALYAKYVEPFKEDPSLPWKSKGIILGSVSILLGIGIYVTQHILWAQIIIGIVLLLHWIGILFFVKQNLYLRGRHCV